MTTIVTKGAEDFSDHEFDAIELHAKDRWEAIEELVDHVMVSHKLNAKHRQEILDAVKAREHECSTGIGSGVALPHATTDLVKDIVCAVGVSKKGIRFNAMDARAVDLVMLFLVPTGHFQRYLNTLASVAKLAQNDVFRQRLKKRFE